MDIYGLYFEDVGRVDDGRGIGDRVAIGSCYQYWPLPLRT